MKLQELREKLLQRSEPPDTKQVISNVWRASEEGTRADREESVTAGPAPGSADTTEFVLTSAETEYDLPLMTTHEPSWISDAFAKRIEELSALLGSIDALSQSTVNGLELLDIFETQMEQLATTLEPVKAFCSKLEQLSRGSQPLRIVHKQMLGVMAQFRAQLLRMANLVEPAVTLRLRATQLAKALEPVDELGVRFARLAGSFQIAQQRDSGTSAP